MEGCHIVGYAENGKAKQKSVLAKTKAECIEKLKKLQAEYTEVASFKVKPDMRFGAWMNYWYENHCKPSIRPTTQKGYEEWIYVHAIPGLWHIPLNKLTQADCQKFLNEMKANGRKKPAKLILQMKAEIAALRNGTAAEYPDGVSPKKTQLAEYLRQHPGVSNKSYIARETGKDRTTVQKYYDEIRTELAALANT